MNSILSIFKILFLSALLAINVVGFHYYFQPAKEENLKFIPESSKFVFSFNLKSISGKLFNEFLFNADDFEKEILTKDEKKLVLENSTYGIDPFGWVSFFSFPFEDRMIHGLSVNLESANSFTKKVEKACLEQWTVDDILIYKNEQSTVFVFDEVAVVLLESMDEELAGDIGVKYLQNQENDFSANSDKDFFVSINKSVFEKSTFKNFFRLVPDFAEGMYLEGNFDKGLISMNGYVKLKNGTINDKDLKFDNGDINKQEIDPFFLHFEGKNISNVIHKYFTGIFTDERDSTGKTKEFLNDNYSSLSYSVKSFKVSTNIFSEQGLMPEYVSSFDLMKEKNLDKISIDLYSSLHMNTFKNPNKIVASVGDSQVKNTLGYFYLHPKKFMEEADLNFVIKSFVDPLIVFEEFVLKAEKVENDRLFFNGETTFYDKEAHSLIQLRLLFKNLTSLI